MGYWQIYRDHSSIILNHLWRHMVPSSNTAESTPYAPVIAVVVEMEHLILAANHALTSTAVRVSVHISG